MDNQIVPQPNVLVAELTVPRRLRLGCSPLCSADADAAGLRAYERAQGSGLRPEHRDALV